MLCTGCSQITIHGKIGAETDVCAPRLRRLGRVCCPRQLRILQVRREYSNSAIATSSLVCTPGAWRGKMELDADVDSKSFMQGLS